MPNCCLTSGPGIFRPEILCRPSSAAQIQLHYHHSDPLVLIRMESTYKPVSAHTYKAMEAEIRSILLPTGTDPLAITAKNIRNAIYRILQSNKSPMTQSTLSRLEEMIKQRRTIFNKSCEGAYAMVIYIGLSFGRLRPGTRTLSVANVLNACTLSVK